MTFASTEHSWDSQVRGLVRQTGMPLKLLAEAVGRGTPETLSWWSGSGRPLEYKNVCSLAQFLGVSLEDLVQGRCSHSLVRARIFQGPQILPDVYATHASSFVRTSAHIVDYLALMYGRHFVDRILLNLNIHPLLFDDLDNRINLKFFITFLNELSRQGLSDSEIESLGCYLFLRIQNTQIGKSFAQAKTYEESYSVLLNEVARFENNFDYEFEIDSRRIRIIAKPTEANQFLKGMSQRDYRLLFLYRHKAFGWFPLLSRLGPLNLRTPKCILRGDSVTVYEAEYSAGVPGFKLGVI